jgi:ABC-type lipoprotein release transport system permease subunit
MLMGFMVMGFISLFVENLIYAVLVLLAILSYFLISSLMIFNVDEKTSEFGMLRALGFKKENIVVLLVLQGCVFSFGGWFVGIISAWIFTVFFKYIFFIQFQMQTDYNLETLAICGSVVLGFLVPLWTNFLSIKKALGNRLRDS